MLIALDYKILTDRLPRGTRTSSHFLRSRPEYLLPVENRQPPGLPRYRRMLSSHLFFYQTVLHPGRRYLSVKGHHKQIQPGAIGHHTFSATSSHRYNLRSPNYHLFHWQNEISAAWNL